MKAVEVIGVSLLTPLGDWDDTWDAILAGKTARCEAPKRYAASGLQAKTLCAFKFQPRLLDMVSAGIEDALHMANLKSADAFCLGSTTAGFTDAEEGRRGAPGDLAREICARFHIPKHYQFSQACSSSGAAIAFGADLIRSGLAQVVVAGGADDLPACVLAGFESVRIHSERCLPFSKHRTGLMLGEGAAFVVLAQPGLGKPLAYVEASALNCDAADSVAPDLKGITSLILDALEDDFNQKVEFAIAHGTATELNDAIEFNAIKDAFTARSLPLPMVSSFKGSLGHPQGASGAFGVALAVKALQQQLAFPTVTEDVDLPFVAQIVTVASRIVINRVMCLSYGSWGTNAAITLSRAV